MVKILFSTILTIGMLGIFGLDSSAKDKKPKATPVTCGSTISAPGNYFLSGDCTGAGIQITASKVTLDLKRHTMTGNGSGVGIGAGGDPLSKVNIFGPGTITNYGVGVFFNNLHNSVIERVSANANGRGLNLNNSSGIKIQKNQANDNLFWGLGMFGSRDNKIEDNEFNGNDSGILLNNSSDNKIEDNEANGNDSAGIELDNNSNENEVEENETNENEIGIALLDSSRNEIKENEANENDFVGIWLLTVSLDNEIEENTALNNNLDLRDDNVNCDNNDWDDNTFVTSNAPCIA